MSDKNIIPLPDHLLKSNSEDDLIHFSDDELDDMANLQSTSGASSTIPPSDETLEFETLSLKQDLLKNQTQRPNLMEDPEFKKIKLTVMSLILPSIQHGMTLDEFIHEWE